jgi:hypothetical protein
MGLGPNTEETNGRFSILAEVVRAIKARHSEAVHSDVVSR